MSRLSNFGLSSALALAAFGISTASAQLNPAANSRSVSSCPAGSNIILGTSASETLRGTNGNDCIIGGGGEDNIDGRGGDDFIVGGDDNDKIRGGQGNDTIFGGGGDDDLRGGNGNDRILGGAGNDTLRGERNDDTLFGGDGDDTLRSGGGDDNLDGGAGDDRVYGGADADLLTGGTGNDNLYGRSGDDHLVGGEANNGGAGVDVCSSSGLDSALCRRDAGGVRSIFLVSGSPSRTNPAPLNGNFVAGDIFAFVPENGIRQVRFFLNDPAASGLPVLVKSAAPFDFCGTQHDGSAAPFPTVRFAPNGANTLTAEVTHLDGSVEIISGTVTVEN
jgi:Ca2+-binding RTX toxin-like protein